MAIENIDLDCCTGCYICVEACPVDVIRWDTKNEKPYIAYPDDCIWCNACEFHCPFDCIVVKPTKDRRDVKGW